MKQNKVFPILLASVMLVSMIPASAMASQTSVSSQVTDSGLSSIVGATNDSSANTEQQVVLADGSMETVPQPSAQLEERLVSARAIEANTLEGFVKRMYKLVLAREPEQDGLQHWVNKLEAGTATLSMLADDFFRSPEFTMQNHSDADFLQIAYNAILDRSPDTAGYAQWYKYLQAGVPQRAVINMFVGSDEFSQLCLQFDKQPGANNALESKDQNADITYYVQTLYINTYSRQADTIGLNAQTNALLTKEVSGAQINSNFLSSPEYEAKNASDDEFLTALYLTMLNRPIDEGGRDCYKNVFNIGYSRAYVANEISKSAEFANLCARYGIEVGSVQLTEPRDIYAAASFVSRVHRVLLAMPAAPASSMNYHAEVLNNHSLTARGFLEAVFSWSEYTSRNLSENDYIDAIYSTTLNRLPSDAEKTQAQATIASNSREHLMRTLLNGAEFRAYANDVNMLPGDFSDLENNDVYLPTDAINGIDVARYQNEKGAINFTQVKNAGYNFVIVRAVSSNNNGIYVDPYFKDNVRKAKAAGLNVGVYLYTYAKTQAYLDAELNVLFNQLALLKQEGIYLDYPVILDLEEQAGLTQTQVSELALYAMERMEQANYRPMLYASANYYQTRMDINYRTLGKYDRWVAAYRSYMGYEGTMWQYTSQKQVPGVVGNTDANYSYRNYPAIIEKDRWNR